MILVGLDQGTGLVVDIGGEELGLLGGDRGVMLDECGLGAEGDAAR